jgi:hypothetical protein
LVSVIILLDSSVIRWNNAVQPWTISWGGVRSP